MKTVHFTPLQQSTNGGGDPAVAAPRKSAGARERLTPAPNAITAMANVGNHLAILNQQYKNLLHSKSRHGDLEVMRSAALNLIENATILIDHEETAG